MTSLSTAPPSTPGGPTSIRTEPVDATSLPNSARAANRLALSEGVFLVTILLAWGLLYLLALSGFEAGHVQNKLYNEFRSQVAAGLAPTGAPIDEGAPVALVDIPAAGLSDSVVVEGSTASLLRHGPGHVRGTVLPGQVGTSVLAARSLTFGAPFRHVHELTAGMPITVRTQQGEFRFRTIGLRQAGDAVPALAAGGSRLVLVTSSGDGPLERTDTVYLDADLVGTPAPAGDLADSHAEDAAMSRDTGVLTWALLALSLQLLVVALCWFVWARFTWSLIAAWTTGLPVVIAALWIVSSTASRLLPNLV